MPDLSSKGAASFPWSREDYHVLSSQGHSELLTAKIIIPTFQRREQRLGDSEKPGVTPAGSRVVSKQVMYNQRKSTGGKEEEGNRASSARAEMRVTGLSPSSWDTGPKGRPAATPSKRWNNRLYFGGTKWPVSAESQRIQAAEPGPADSQETELQNPGQLKARGRALLMTEISLSWDRHMREASQGRLGANPRRPGHVKQETVADQVLGTEPQCSQRAASIHRICSGEGGETKAEPRH